MENFFSYIQVFFLALFLSFIIGKTIYLKRKTRINPIAIRLGRDGIRHLVEVLLLLLVNVWSFEVLFYALGTGFRIFGPLDIRLVDSFALKILGLFTVFLGFVFFILALINLGTSWRLGIDEKKPGKLVRFGIYRYSRHPIYVFFNLYFLGTFLIWGNLIFLLFWLAVAAILHYQILEEEKFLTRLYKQQYTGYMKKVGRYLSFKPAAFRRAEYIKGLKQSRD
ncbi:MAG: methyltransferase family protein [Actinomycetota bacterium]